MRMLTACLCWATWLCAMVAITAGVIRDWSNYGLRRPDMMGVGVTVFVLYLTAAVIGVKVFQTLWPKTHRNS